MLTELPFELPGRVFRSPMPFGSSDPEGVIYPTYKHHKVSVVVVLAGDDECLQKAKRNLRELYAKDKLQVIHLPILDFGVPNIDELKLALHQTITHAQAGRNVAIHCSAGVGRTGLFAACLARKVWGLPGEEAIRWVRRYISNAVETPEQKLFVTSFQL